MHSGVGVLNQARQQADEHSARLRFGKLLCHYGDRRRRGHFAKIHATHSVGNCKQITVGARLLT